MVKNGRVYTRAGLKSIDLWIREGKVAALGGAHHAEDEIEAYGMMVLPGAIDVHVHFRDPGPIYKEDWESGSVSAAAGGVTTVVDQPNTDPRTRDARSFELKLERAKVGSVVDFCLNGGPGKIDELQKAGAPAIGEIFTYEHSDHELQMLLEETEKAGLFPTVHAEDGSIIKEKIELLKCQHGPEVHSQARPAVAEAVAIEKVLNWSRSPHICHLSSAMGLQRIRAAKMGGKKVSCEVAPHHLLLSSKDYRKQGSFLKVNPPIRTQADNDALWMGLRDGSIDILASDHAPHLPEEKREDIWEAPSGVPGVETLLPLMLFAVRRNLIGLERMVNALTTGPAKVFGLESKGKIEIGKDADLVIVDPKKITVIDAQRLHSRADWTPYQGMEAIFPQLTLLRGSVIYDGDVQVRRGFGRFLSKSAMQRVL